jgi:hypothetical protein
MDSDLAFCFFSYLIDCFGFNASELPCGDGLNTVASRPIGG